LSVSGQQMPPEYHRAYQVGYKDRENVKERRRQQARLRHRDPVERYKANVRRTTRAAIAAGKLVRQPCEVCGLTKVDAHHDDYDQALAVRWLCRVHHRHLHAAKARGEAA
jgi:hypothetical protein